MHKHAKKMVQKIVIQQRYLSFTDYENINFVLETSAIAQMKGLFILIASCHLHKTPTVSILFFK